MKKVDGRRREHKRKTLNTTLHWMTRRYLDLLSAREGEAIGRILDKWAWEKYEEDQAARYDGLGSPHRSTEDLDAALDGLLSD